MFTKSHSANHRRSLHCMSCPIVPACNCWILEPGTSTVAKPDPASRHQQARERERAPGSEVQAVRWLCAFDDGNPKSTVKG